MTATWLVKATAKARDDYKTWAHKKELEWQSIDLSGDLQEGSPDNLNIWEWTSTRKFAKSVSPTGAALLPKSPFTDDEVPRLQGWMKILKELGWDKTGFVAAFLVDVEFQHHMSTNGRMNVELERWERQAVRSVEQWMRGPHRSVNDPPVVSKRTFHRIKDRLVSLGLIRAESHLWRGKTLLWVVPTEKLSRIVFEPGYWQQLRPSYLGATGVGKKPSKVAPTAKTAKAPRGLSAKHIKLDSEARELYRKAMNSEFIQLSDKEKWAVYDRLTKPKALGPNHIKKPFAPKGSYKAKRVYDALALSFYK